MRVQLIRYSYSPNETEGMLFVGNRVFYTIEKPWRLNRPRVSCIPEGEYDFISHTRPNGDQVYMISNPALGVYKYPEDLPAGVEGRTLILLHAANFEKEVIGCIAPGLERGPLTDSEGVVRNGVKRSRAAMEEILGLLGTGTYRLNIGQVRGAR